MAFRRRIGGLAELLLKQHLAQQNQENAASLQFQREQASKLADLGYAEAMSHAKEGGDLGSIPTGIMQRLGPVLQMARPSIEDVMGKVGGQIQSAQKPTDLPTDIGGALRAAAPKFTDLQGIQTPAPAEGQEFMAPGGQPDYAIPAAPEGAAGGINDLMKQRGEREAALLADVQRQSQQKVAEAGATTGAQKRAGLAPDIVAGENAAAGGKAAAEAAARFPFEQKLAQTRANATLLTQKAMYDYQREHPKATAQELNRQSSATAALNMIPVIRGELDELDKQGMTGALVGRARDVAAGKVKSEQLFKTPYQAALATKFESDVKLMTSLASYVHFGQRGGVGGVHLMEGVLSSAGDKSIVGAQLDSVAQLMDQYAHNPNLPTVSTAENPSVGNLFGLTQAAPEAPPDPLANPWIQSKLRRR